MQEILRLMPEIELDEAQFIGNLLKGRNEDDIKNFISIYRTRRKDPQTILLTALIGFLGISGVHRFLVNQIGMGILYFFTAGFCFIGTIVDLINYKSLALEYNQKTATEINALFIN
jgi:TM2 domain-containing membrane protein YozV